MSTTTHTVLPEGFAGLTFSNRYARLPDQFYARVKPALVEAPALIKVNHGLAEELGLDPTALESPEGVECLAGNALPLGAEPLAQAYAGHQFGYFNPQLGDGRAILLGEVVDRYGRLRDIQLKGSGLTPFSRQGDGRAAVGPVIREYILSEAMYALGIKTTRSLAAVTTGESVYRETALPGAVLTRVASSHIRVGTFEYFRGRGDNESIKQLADFVIERHFSHAVRPQVTEADNPYLALLDAVIDAQASLVASWLHVGFIHGVMNTDNTSISGETIDYGPCAFMDRYDPATVYSSIDREGRYAYGRQPNIALWNLSRFAECLLHLFDDDIDAAVSKAKEHLARFSSIFDDYWLSGMRRKIGLQSAREGDEQIVQALMNLMQQNRADFTIAFRHLSHYLHAGAQPDSQHPFIQLFERDPVTLQRWLTSWQARLTEEEQSPTQLAEAMLKTNPAYIPRNHRVEAVIRAAMEEGDYQPLHEMVEVLSRPYEEQPSRDLYAQPPAPGEEVLQTFCGT